MREHPILFSGPMVRAILEGRKTMTRRVVKKNQFPKWFHDRAYQVGVKEAIRELPSLPCPYGQPGDRLWVRETFCHVENFYGESTTWYRADSDNWGEATWGWKPSIFMPRTLSRILLDITAERVERVLDITDEDALLEGISEVAPGDRYPYGVLGADKIPRGKTPRTAFLALWDSLNGGTSPSSENPWVWALSILPVSASATC